MGGRSAESVVCSPLESSSVEPSPSEDVGTWLVVSALLSDDDDDVASVFTSFEDASPSPSRCPEQQTKQKKMMDEPVLMGDLYTKANRTPVRTIIPIAFEDVKSSSALVIFSMSPDAIPNEPK